MRVIRILAVSVVAVACARDAPLAPGPATDPATEQFAALAATLTDAQAWLLPGVGERDLATDAIAERFADLATSLVRADSGVLAPRMAAARQELVAGTAAEPGEQFIQLAALGLVLDDVEAVIQGRLRLVPLNAAGGTSPDSLSEHRRPKSDRSLP
jgi:hypothetical protein